MIGDGKGGRQFVSVHAVKAYEGSRFKAPLILIFGAR